MHILKQTGTWTKKRKKKQKNLEIFCVVYKKIIKNIRQHNQGPHSAQIATFHNKRLQVLLLSACIPTTENNNQSPVRQSKNILLQQLILKYLHCGDKPFTTILKHFTWINLNFISLTFVFDSYFCLVSKSILSTFIYLQDRTACHVFLFFPFLFSCSHIFYIMFYFTFRGSMYILNDCMCLLYV